MVVVKLARAAKVPAANPAKRIFAHPERLALGQGRKFAATRAKLRDRHGFIDDVGHC